MHPLLLPKKVVGGVETAKDVPLHLRLVRERLAHQSVAVCEMQVERLVGADQAGGVS